MYGLAIGQQCVVLYSLTVVSPGTYLAPSSPSSESIDKVRFTGVPCTLSCARDINGKEVE